MDGHGTTITFATSAFTGALIAVNGLSIERETIEDTVMATENAKLFLPAKLYDGGTLDLEVKFNPALTPPVMTQTAVENCTITWPDTTTWVFSVCHTGYQPGASSGERMTATMSCKVSGTIAI